MYTLFGRSCPLIVIFAIFAGWLQRSQGLTVKQDKWPTSCSSAISSKSSVEVGITDTHWADFMGYENGTSTSVQLDIRRHWEWFPSRSLRVSIASAWDSESTKTKRDVRLCVEGYLSRLSLDVFFKLKCFLSREHEQGYGSICSISED